MTTKMNLNGTTRKALVTAIAEITGEQPIYRKVPTCNYDIGDITVTKDGSIICPDDSSILASLEEAGFTAKSDDAADQNEATGLTVSLPKDGFTDSAIDNLGKLVDAKAALMRKALGADRLDIEVTEDKVSFPWWDTLPEAEDTQAYISFITALCGMAKDAKRVLAKETEVESEKYAFRCFLLRLGYVGNDRKAARKILLRNLSGHSAFRNKAEEKSSGLTRKPSEMPPKPLQKSRRRRRRMTNTVREQILSIRDTGKTNMFDIPMVQRLAYDYGYYELVCWLEEHQKEYIHFILTGEA